MEREHEELLMQYMDGELDEPALERLQSLLQNDRQFQEEFLKLTRQERVLRVLLRPEEGEQSTLQVLNQIKAQETGDAFVESVQKEITGRRMRVTKSPRPGSSRVRRSVRARRSSSQRNPSWLMPLSAAALVLIAFGLFFAFREKSPQLAVLATVTVSGADVVAEGPVGKRNLNSGSALNAGDVIRTSSSADVSFKYDDGTVVKLNSGAAATLLGENAAKQIRLANGKLDADVQPQPDNQPFAVFTAHAKATVRGTVLTVSASSDEARLDVRHGKVDFQRLADGAQVQVAAGFYATATRDTSIAMKALEINPQTVTPPVVAVRDGTAEDFEKRVFKGKGQEIPYRLFVPLNYDKSKKYPLVLFLHGLGEKGTDNTKPLNKNALGALVYVSAKTQIDNPCFMVVPQAASGWWPDYVPSLAQLMADLPKEFSIDTDRLYVTGLSFGGTGTWNIIEHHPTLFAAAVPICGAGDPAMAKAVVNIPIWNFHTADDPTMKVEGSRAMINAIRKAGGTPYYTEYAKGGHGSAWTRCFQEPGLIPWVMAQRKGKPATEPSPLPFPH